SAKMLAGSGAPPPEENPTERKYNFLLQPRSRGPAYWPLISANSLVQTKDKSPNVGKSHLCQEFALSVNGGASFLFIAVPTLSTNPRELDLNG
ncbi:MAG: hypothetical protein WAN28_13195, partial [Terracidiphilus sp.]